MTTKEYQFELYSGLQKKFAEVENEWRAFKHEGIHQYAPRVDIAIGPFNDNDDENETLKVKQKYIKMVQGKYKAFLTKAYEMHETNLDRRLYTSVAPAGYLEVVNFSDNPRCFIAIEIENKNSRKHIMGSVVNAASLAKIGIGIGFTDATTKTFLRIVNYLSKLEKLEKNTYKTSNLMVLTRKQMEGLL